jgi:hypothetical protein
MGLRRCISHSPGESIRGESARLLESVTCPNFWIGRMFQERKLRG